eukprot:19835-Heterococcus_DN1.PRE.2
MEQTHDHALNEMKHLSPSQSMSYIICVAFYSSCMCNLVSVNAVNNATTLKQSPKQQASALH